MKTLTHPPTGPRGFALVSTLLLMALLTLTAVGFLSLSAISLRQSGNLDAQAQAKANARLAIMVALGELQRTLGKDTAVTASSDLTLPPGSGQRHLTGVWDSWPVPLGGSPNYSAEKDARFRGWLVSDTDRTKPAAKGYPASNPTNSVELYKQDPDTSTGKVLAGVVKVGSTGAYAWHVADESVKARIDLSRDPGRTDTLHQKRSLVSGHRPGARSLGEINGFDFSKLPSDANAAGYQAALPVGTMLVNRSQVELVGGKKLPPSLRHDVTTHSLGVLADVAEGGLKKDLSTAFGTGTTGLPAELAGKRIYESTHGTSGISDPYWSNLSGYHNLYKGIADPNAIPSLPATAVLEGTSTTPPAVPKEYILAPVIQRVDLNFNLYCFKMFGNLYLFLMFQPVVVIHNPYNVKIEFERFTTVIEEPPLLFQFGGNIRRETGETATNPLVKANGWSTPLSLGGLNGSFYWASSSKNATNRPAVRLEFPSRKYTSLLPANERGTITMDPGQTLCFSPWVHPGGQLDSSQPAKATTATPYWTKQGCFGPFGLHVQETLKDSTIYSTVYNSDLGTSVAESEPLEGSRLWYGTVSGIALRELTGTSANKVLFKAGNPFNPLNTLSFRITAALPHSNRRDWKIASFVKRKNGIVHPVGQISFDWGSDPAKLREIFGGLNTVETLNVPASMFYVGDFGTHSAPPPTPLISYGTKLGTKPPYTFATFSMVAKTGNGGVYETGQRRTADSALNRFFDGRLSGKPFIHDNLGHPSYLCQLNTEKFGMQSHEINFIKRDGDLEDVMEIDAKGSTPGLLGNRVVSGIKTGAMFDIPSGPLQSLAGLRRSNVFSSSYLPRSTQPFSNSWAHPTMRTSEAKGSVPSISYELLDHSYLGNAALYDSHYFSTIAPEAEPSSGASTHREIFESFARGDEPLPNQSYQPWKPDATPLAVAADRMFADDESPEESTWKEIAAWQMVKGAFNVNSTSVPAWKAMLASLSDTSVPVAWAKSLGLETVSPGKPVVASMTMPLSGAADPGASIDPTKVDNERTNQWNGFRTLTPAQLDELAAKIVDEVRLRGPFLSMAEFVNRRLGTNSELTRVGALQSAINKAQLNNGMFSDIPEVTTSDLPDSVYGYQTPEAATGNPAEGAPGTITQGDLMNILEPRITVRGDTFVIRGMGRALDKAGNVMATAYAEAVVQRVPDYIDPADKAHLPASSTTNTTFGRRFEIVSMRWLQTSEL